MTHVCQAWREVLTSRCSLWTNLHCKDADKTRVYLERSKLSPINISLNAAYALYGLSSANPFVQAIPHAFGRLRSLSVKAAPENLQRITSHLSHRAPLLQELSIHGGYHCQQYPNTLPPTLFDGDFSSLHKLCLEYVRTELPWRNMANLTSFTMAYTLSDQAPIARLLDFFESVPQLREVELCFTTIPGAQPGRLVSLACLKKMAIFGGRSSVLLDHLLIPAGAKLITQGDSFDPQIEDHLPMSLDNLQNLPNFTAIQLSARSSYPHVKFSGPNGRVEMHARTSQFDEAWPLLNLLARFDTSKTEQLKIDHGNSRSSDPPYQMFLPMKDLRTLTLHLCESLDTFTRALDPSMNPSGDPVCPKLEEVIVSHRERFAIGSVVRMAAARASRGAKLKSVGLACPYKFAESDVLELKKHVWRVECRVFSASMGGDMPVVNLRLE